jgi:FAD-dependent oxidoreductase domain-containing protein 1
MTKDRAEVVIIGGGVVGSSIAFNLLADGFKGKIVVLERDPTYEHASSSLATGGVRQQFGTAINIQLSRYSVRFYERFDEIMTVDEEKGHAEFQQVGYLFLGNQQNWPALRRRLAVQRDHRVAVEVLNRDAIHRIVPGLTTDDLEGATFGPKDGVLDPSGVLQGFVRKAKSLGAEFMHDEVVEITRDNQGVSGIRTKKEVHVASRLVVNAAGPWAREVARAAGVDIPVVPVRRQIFVCLPSSEVQCRFPLVIDPGGAHWRSETGGRILVAKAKRDEPPGFNFTWDRSYFTDEIWPELAHRYPPFDRLRLERGWAGLYAVTPDENAIYGEHPELRGFYLANGFSGHGLMMAPATGKVMSEILRLGASKTIDVSCLSLERFETGELIREEAVI